MEGASTISIFATIILGTLITHLIGFVWYSAFFGELWRKAAKLDEKQMPKDISASLIMELIGRAIRTIVFVLFFTSLKINSLSLSIQLAMFLWMGFTVPHTLSRIAWEQKTWDYFIINVSEQCVVLLVLSGVCILML